MFAINKSIQYQTQIRLKNDARYWLRTIARQQNEITTTKSRSQEMGNT